MNDNFDLNEQTFEAAAPEAEQAYKAFVPYGFTPKTYEEKKGIRKTALIIGVCMLIMLGITLFWAPVYLAIMALAGFSVERAYEIINDPAVLQVAQIILSSLMFTVPFIIVFKCGGFRISDLVILKKPEKKTALPLLLLGISFCSFANIAVSFASAIFESAGVNYEVDNGENPEGIFGFLLSLLATAIVPALIEEFACRGLILGSLRKYGDGFALITSSILFGIMHGNFQQIPFAFLVGLGFGFVAIKSGSLWISMAVHAFNNFISVFFDYCMSGISNEVKNVCYILFLCVALLSGIAALFLLRKNDEDFYRFEKSDTESSDGKKYKWFFSSAAIIIFIVISVGESMLYFQ